MQSDESSVVITFSNVSYGRLNSYNYFMNEKDYKNLKIALASSAMEGLNITRQTEADCIRLINGEVSVDEMVGEIIARYAG